MKLVRKMYRRTNSKRWRSWKQQFIKREKEMKEQTLILIKHVCTISKPIYAFDKCVKNKDFRETTKRTRTSVLLTLFYYDSKFYFDITNNRKREKCSSFFAFVNDRIIFL